MLIADGEHPSLPEMVSLLDTGDYSYVVAPEEEDAARNLATKIAEKGLRGLITRPDRILRLRHLVTAVTITVDTEESSPVEDTSAPWTVQHRGRGGMSVYKSAQLIAQSQKTD